MKSKVNFSTSVFGDVRELCASVSELYPKPKVLVCINLKQVYKSLIGNGAVPLRKKEISPEAIMLMEIMIPKKHTSSGELQTIEIGKINVEKSKGNELWYDDNTECWIVNEAVLEDLLLLRMYAENNVTVSY